MLKTLPLIVSSLLLFSCCSPDTAQCAGSSLEGEKEFVRGINILSRNEECALRAIDGAASAGDNHLELSHRLIMNLCQLRDSSTLNMVSTLAARAHAEGISEVCVWDHALYDTDYYPTEFYYPGTGLLDLDKPELWDWIAADYRDMLSLCPEIDGLVLTFIESGAGIEHQFSSMSVPQRLAKVVNTVSRVVCGEFGKTLWLRTFAYNEKQYADITDCFEMVDWRPGMGLMIKESPHDFFLTHPANPLIGRLAHPTLVEFDACGEYHGQGVIAGMIPEHFAERWRSFRDLPDVVGYVARTDRCGDYQIIGTAMEINLHALRRVTDGALISVKDIEKEFITARYGSRTLKPLRKAFRASRDIIDGSMYILGLNTASHSAFRLDDPSTFSRHVAGRWTGSDSVFLAHGVDREFHWWRDLVSVMAPPSCKKLDAKRAADISEVLAAGLIAEGEMMSEEYIDYALAWTDDCLKGARKGLRALKRARRSLSPEDYAALFDMYERSLMCMRLRRDSLVVDWGERAMSRGEELRTRSLERKVARARRQLRREQRRYASYSKPYPKGTWDFLKDAE